MEAPKFSDPKWNDHVLSCFSEDELDNGYPKLHGLRRVTEMLIGRIDSNQVELVQNPIPENSYSAIVKCNIECVAELCSNRYSDIGEANPHNIKAVEFKKYPLAIALARAEARVLRKLLRLKIISADEMEGSEGFELINETQISAINLICKRNNINALELLKDFMRKNDLIKRGKFSYRKMPHDVAAKLIDQLSEDQYAITDELKNYVPDWR